MKIRSRGQRAVARTLIGRSRLWREFLQAAAAIVLILLTACNPIRTRELYAQLEGPRPELDSADIEGFVERQTSAVNQLVALAGLAAKPAPGSPAWQAVLDAGMLYVDQVCDDYMGALFWFDRWRDSAKSGVALTGASAAAAMGILGAAAEAVALTATAFGLTTALIDVGANTVLYNIEPSAVRSALERAQAAYRDELARRANLYDNQAAVLAAVQGYLALCLPASLETTINTAVAQANIGETGTQPGNPVPSVRVRPLDVFAPLPPTAPLPVEQQISNPRSPAEQALSRGQGGLIQEALCVRPDGDFGTGTREAIVLYRRARDGLEAGDPRLRQPLSQQEIVTLLGAGPCPSAPGYRTAYERFAFPTEDAIRALQTQLAEVPEAPALQVTGRFDDATRAAVRELQRRFQLGDIDTVTPELLNRIAV
jgi:peptidoglycan hydrolase-like protein with peptidoglycan-binding domain